MYSHALFYHVYILFINRIHMYVQFNTGTKRHIHMHVQIFLHISCHAMSYF